MNRVQLPGLDFSAQEDAREARILVMINILLAYVLALAHTSKSLHFLEWTTFIAFEGWLPFQSRVLPFLIAHGLDSIQHLSPRSIGRLFLALDFAGALIAATFLLKSLQAIGSTRAGMLLALTVFWWQLFATFVVSPVHNYYYPYDLLSVGIMSVGTWAILTQQRIRVLALIGAVGMLNRETAILIPMLYLAANWPRDRAVGLNFLTLLAICLLVRLSIHFALNAPGGATSPYVKPGELRFIYNFSFLSLKSSAMHTFNVLFAFGGAWLLLLLRGATPPRFNYMALCFFPYFLGMSVVGNLSEIRVFGEFIPLLSLMLGCKLAPRPDAFHPTHISQHA